MNYGARCIVACGQLGLSTPAPAPPSPPPHTARKPSYVPCLPSASSAAGLVFDADGNVQPRRASPRHHLPGELASMGDFWSTSSPVIPGLIASCTTLAFLWVINADSINEAVERILSELKEGVAGTSSGRHNVIYFDGWDGLGAFTVLREVGRRLGAHSWYKIIHIDCSKWESRRAMQRALAEQLELPASVMEMFDAQDEEDNYNGVGKGLRAEIPEVASEIYQQIQKLNSRFLVIFHNGSCDEVDLDTLGFPLAGYSRNRALWSFQGKFRLYPRMKVHKALNNARPTTDVVLSATSTIPNYLSKLLLHEAAEVVGEINLGGDIRDWPAQAANCLLYMMKLCRMGNHLIDYDLATHGYNYWLCDGIIQLDQGDVGTDNDGPDTLWVSSDALWREMRLDPGYYKNNSDLESLDPVVRRLTEMPYWTSPTYGFMLIPDEHKGYIPKDMLLRFDKICVLKLSDCKFSFKSPPFLCCQDLRFLWINHCQDEDKDRWVNKRDDEDVQRRFFQRLWVLDVRSSMSDRFLSTSIIDFMTQLRELNLMREDYWDMGRLQGRLHNIRRLRVTKSHTSCYRDDPGNLFSGKDKMELLDFSGNDAATMRRLSVASSCSSLETVIIDGCKYLQEISLNGCAKLKNLLLSGLFPDLDRLDITGTPVETLDLSKVAAPMLDKLFLLDCGKLCAILWPPADEDRRKRYLGTLHMDNTPKEGSNTVTAPAILWPPALKGISPTDFCWYISTRNTRILWSLEPFDDYFGPNVAHVEILTSQASPTAHTCADAAATTKDAQHKSSSGQHVQVNLQQLKGNAIYDDVDATLKKYTRTHIWQEEKEEAKEGDTDDAPYDNSSLKVVHIADCYMHIEDQMRTKKSQTASINVPTFVCDGTKILHVHESLFVSTILASPTGSAWNKLEWCRVERCPKLECVFSNQLAGAEEGRSSSDVDVFEKLRTIWASHLPNVRYILERSPPRPGAPRHTAFADLTSLHLYCCPRLLYAVPLPPSGLTSMQHLETLKIMWCGNLRVVFHFNQDWVVRTLIGVWTFPKLKHIHLHELPMLQGMNRSAYAPKLETIKVRGCWSLRSLPVVGIPSSVNCDCEKEWWDRLEWVWGDYKPTHPRHYKKTMIRDSVLR